MKVVERAFSFMCDRDKLCGILHQSSSPGERGVLVVVGGPQYRVGSHRQFILLGRKLAASGISVMRFDYRGMGDSEGRKRSFENIDLDIKSAVDKFVSEAGIKEVILWGLCDGASAAIFYAHQDPRIVGLVVLNPWVRSEQSLANAYLRHYYASRFFSGQLWEKVIRGQFSIRKPLVGFVQNLGAAWRIGSPKSENGLNQCVSNANVMPIEKRMAETLGKFTGRTLIILSGQDITAAEFVDVSSKSAHWRRQLDRASIETRHLPHADHTFSDPECRISVENWTLELVDS